MFGRLLWRCWMVRPGEGSLEGRVVRKPWLECWTTRRYSVPVRGSRLLGDSAATMWSAAHRYAAAADVTVALATMTSLCLNASSPRSPCMRSSQSTVPIVHRTVTADPIVPTQGSQ
jgi:hypothetical protein